MSLEMMIPPMFFYLLLFSLPNTSSARIESFISPTNYKSRTSTSFRRERITEISPAATIEGFETVSRSSNNSNDNEERSKEKNAEILISIGPPCSDKKYALEAYLLSQGYNLGENSDENKSDGGGGGGSDDDTKVWEINLRDNSVGVYHRVPLAAFIYPATHLTEKIGDEILYSDVTVRDRLFDPGFEQTDSEIRNVILRLAGRITPDDFGSRIREQARKAGDTVEYFKRRRLQVAEDLIVAVEEVAAEAVGEILFQMQLKRDEALASEQDELPYGEDKEDEETPLDLSSIDATPAHIMSAQALVKTPHVDLFVPQAIFNGGIGRSEEVLKNLLLLEESSVVPVIWGNTNTRPSEYETALSAAEKAKRPVKFIAWGTGLLPRVSRKELLKRNVARFRSTGRYIPAGAIGGALDRVETLLQMAKETVQTLSNDLPKEYIVDAAFASLCGYEMQQGGFVVKTGECQSLRQPFRRQNRRNRIPRKKTKYSI